MQYSVEVAKIYEAEGADQGFNIRSDLSIIDKNLGAVVDVITGVCVGMNKKPCACLTGGKRSGTTNVLYTKDYRSIEWYNLSKKKVVHTTTLMGMKEDQMILEVLPFCLLEVGLISETVRRSDIPNISKEVRNAIADESEGKTCWMELTNAVSGINVGVLEPKGLPTFTGTILVSVVDLSTTAVNVHSIKVATKTARPVSSCIPIDKGADLASMVQSNSPIFKNPEDRRISLLTTVEVKL